MLLGYADYLVDATLNPALQFVMPDERLINQTAKQTNVALAGIIAIRAMAELLAARGDATASAKYKVCIVSSTVKSKSADGYAGNCGGLHCAVAGIRGHDGWIAPIVCGESLVVLLVCGRR